MLKGITNLFTSATAPSVAIRYITTIVGSLVFILATIGALTPEQVARITEVVDKISGRLPELIAAIAGLVALIAPIYATMTKSSSDKAAAVAKEVDKQIPASAPVVIQTPDSQPNIVVPPSAK
jgi:hypothetical protein